MRSCLRCVFEVAECDFEVDVALSVLGSASTFTVYFWDPNIRICGFLDLLTSGQIYFKVIGFKFKIVILKLEKNIIRTIISLP